MLGRMTSVVNNCAGESVVHTSREPVAADTNFYV